MMTLSARLAVRVTVVPTSAQAMRTLANGAAAVTVTVAAAGAQAKKLMAAEAVIVTVAATGADTTRPLGWGAVTVTCREEGGARELNGGMRRPGDWAVRSQGSESPSSPRDLTQPGDQTYHLDREGNTI